MALSYSLTEVNAIKKKAIEAITRDPTLILSDVETRIAGEQRRVAEKDFVHVDFDGKCIEYMGTRYTCNHEYRLFNGYACISSYGCTASINLANSAKPGRVLAILRNRRHNHRCRLPENYNEETGWALVLEDFFDCCEALTRKGIELTKDVFANGFDQAIIQDLPDDVTNEEADEIKKAIDCFNGFVTVYKSFLLKFGNNLGGNYRVYGYLNVESKRIKNRLEWIGLLCYNGKSGKDVKTRAEAENDTYRGNDLRQSCGGRIFDCVQFLEGASDSFASTSESLIQFLFVKRADGFQQMVNRRYETAEDKYLMGTETQNLMVAAFILVRGILFGRVEEVQLRKQKERDLNYSDSSDNLSSNSLKRRRHRNR